MFWVWMIVIASALFVLAVIKMSFSHYEKIMRIKHGVPTEGAREDYN
ncbi:MAG: hypothetical protein LBT59_03180 [Clostridiales bacterium]|jgi:hypothetical protein|nr:hypothetical protein [Clostridiales bacterium]